MIKELKAEQVRLKCNSSILKCSSTEDIIPYEGIIGQERALSALKFGLNIQKPGFNIFVSGLAGTGKTTVIKSFLDTLAVKKDTPPDWCYVYNFKDSDRPNALKVPAGTGQALQKDMKHIIDSIRRSLIQTFASKEYSNRRSELIDALNKKRETIFNTFSKKAKDKSLLLKASQIGLMLLPASGDQPMGEEAYQKLTQEEKDVMMKNREELMNELKDKISELQVEENNVEKQLEENDHEVVKFTIGHIFEEMKSKYANLPQVVTYMGDVEQDIIENFAQFKIEPKNNITDPMIAMQEMNRKQALTKYEVNVLVDNSVLKGAPVILELNPTFNNLLGRTEKDAQFGALFTDFTMIKSGSLHRANGGFLVMRIEDILSNFQSWEGLKRTLRDGNLIIEEISERLGYLAVKSLRPEPIPLDIKVVIIGEPMYYYLLLRLDREFSELFKVKADFDSLMDRNDKNLKDYAAVICRICREEKLKHLKSDALAKIIEYSSRLAENQEKLSTLFADIADIIREANFWSDEDKTRLIDAKHIQRAIEQKVYRNNLVQQHINEMINDGTIMIDTDGEAIGQVNGLAVIDMGDFAFGRPSRITASLGLGRDGVVDIEREARLGGKLHTKGVMILNGHITEKYARDIPLSLSARLVFEQSYNEVDGDSASSTELYALLSKLADAPIKQGFAVTGSINQKGEVQAIGGVNEKIEGFFEVCRAKGFTCRQGVIIPASNVKNLMLKEDVVDAVAKGNFHIYPVNTIDEGIEILTGIKAGKRLKNNKFQSDSINYRVQKRLITLANKLRDFGKTEDKPEKKHRNSGNNEEGIAKPKK